MSESPFIAYLNEVDSLLESRYGITSNDTDLGAIADSQIEGWTAKQCVAWIAEKYDLDRIDTAYG